MPRGGAATRVDMHRLEVRRNLVVYLDMGCHPNCEGAEALSFDYLIPTRQIFDFCVIPVQFWGDCGKRCQTVRER